MFMFAVPINSLILTDCSLTFCPNFGSKYNFAGNLNWGSPQMNFVILVSDRTSTVSKEGSVIL